MTSLMTTAGGENAPASVRRIASETASTGGHRPTGERGTPRRPAPSTALRALEAGNPVSAKSRSACGDSFVPDSRLRIEPPPFAGCSAASAPLSFDPTPAASVGIGFGGEGMRPLGDEDVTPAGFARTGERLVRTGEVAPFRPCFRSETGFAHSGDDADGFGTRRAHAPAAGSDGNIARVEFSELGIQDPSTAESSEKPTEGCGRWMRGDRLPTLPPKPCETPLRYCLAEDGAHPESPPNPGGAPCATSLSRSVPGEAASSSAIPPPHARGGADSRQTTTAWTKPKFAAVTDWQAKSVVAIEDDETPAIEADAPLSETNSDNFAAVLAPLAPRTRKRAFLASAIVKEYVDAAQTVNSVPSPLVKRSGMAVRNELLFMGLLRKSKPCAPCKNELEAKATMLSYFIVNQTNLGRPRLTLLIRDEFRSSPFMKENPGSVRFVRKGEDASNFPEFANFSLFSSHVSLRIPLRGIRNNRRNRGFREGRYDRRFVSIALAPDISGIKSRKELAP